MDPYVINERQQAFNGRVYHLKTKGRYYQCTVGPGRVSLLHRAVWEAAHGPIPGPNRAWHVHHKDHNPANNRLDNLELQSASEHQSGHWTPERRARARESMIANVVPAARAWHGTEEGLAWHAEHGRAVAAIRAAQPPEARACVVCASPFDTRTAHAKCCSAKCRAQHTRNQRRAGVPINPARQTVSRTEPKARTCTDCGATFESRSARALRCEPCGAANRHAWYKAHYVPVGARKP